MFTITYNNKGRSWIVDENISLDDGMAHLRALGRGRHWLYVSSYDDTDDENRILECVLSIAVSEKKRYHVTFNDYRPASRGRWRAIDPSLREMTGTVLVRASGYNERRRIYETVEMDEAENVVREFFAKKQMSDMHKTVWESLN